MQGMALAIHHTYLSVIVQFDSSMALSVRADDYLDRSAYDHLALEIKALLVDRELISQKLHRGQNRVPDS